MHSYNKQIRQELRDNPDGLNDIPNFAAWSHGNLAKFAEESYIHMQAQHEAIKQLLGDLKDAMVQVRQLLKEKND
jgi:hypothetical protein